MVSGVSAQHGVSSPNSAGLRAATVEEGTDRRKEVVVEERRDQAEHLPENQAQMDRVPAQYEEDLPEVLQVPKRNVLV